MDLQEMQDLAAACRARAEWGSRKKFGTARDSAATSELLRKAGSVIAAQLDVMAAAGRYQGLRAMLTAGRGVDFDPPPVPPEAEQTPEAFDRWVDEAIESYRRATPCKS